MRAALGTLLAVVLLGLLVFTDVIARHPENIERDPDNWRTYRAHINHGIAAREAGNYSAAITSLMYANINAPKPSRSWMIATINLAMCCEVLGQDAAADAYYRDAGKFCTLSNNMRTGGAWRKMRNEIEENRDGL